MILTADHFEGLAEIPIDQLVPSADNPRSDLGDLDGLVASIHAAGIIEPLIVTANGPHGYHVVAGHRRLAAACLAGLETVPCIHRGFKSTAERIEVAAIENLQRADLSPLDEARAMQQLVDLGHTQHDIAERIGCNQSHVSRRLALLELDDDTADKLRRGEVKVREAEQIARPPALPAVDPILPPAKNLTPPRPKPRVEPAWEGETCNDCGGRYERTIWEAPDELWMLLVGKPGGLLCPGCFDDRAKAVGLFLRWVPVVDHRLDLAPDAAEVQADLSAEPEVQASIPEASPIIDVAVERIYGEVEFENPEWLQRSPWPGYRAAKDAALVARIAKRKSVDELRHVVAYEWGAAKAPRRPEILVAALARLDELSAVGLEGGNR